MISRIEELTQKVKFYEDMTTVLMDEYKAQVQECTGKDKSSTAGLSEDDEAWVQSVYHLVGLPLSFFSFHNT